MLKIARPRRPSRRGVRRGAGLCRREDAGCARRDGAAAIQRNLRHHVAAGASGFPGSGQLMVDPGRPVVKVRSPSATVINVCTKGRANRRTTADRHRRSSRAAAFPSPRRMPAAGGFRRGFAAARGSLPEHRERRRLPGADARDSHRPAHSGQTPAALNSSPNLITWANWRKSNTLIMVSSSIFFSCGIPQERDIAVHKCRNLQHRFMTWRLLSFNYPTYDLPSKFV